MKRYQTFAHSINTTDLIIYNCLSLSWVETQHIFLTFSWDETEYYSKRSCVYKLKMISCNSMLCLFTWIFISAKSQCCRMKIGGSKERNSKMSWFNKIFFATFHYIWYHECNIFCQTIIQDYAKNIYRLCILIYLYKWM